MQDEKYFRAIDTVKMSDEQRDTLFEKILQKENEMSSEKIAVHCYEEKRFSLKNIFYPAAVAAAIAVTIASASYANKNENENSTLSDIPGTVSHEQTSEQPDIRIHRYSSGPSESFSLTGSVTERNYFTKTKHREESRLVPASEDTEAPEFRYSSGNLLTNIKKAVQYGDRTAVLSYSEFDNYWSVHVYNSELVIDYTFRSSNGNPVFTLSDDFLYLVESESDANAYGSRYDLILHRIPLDSDVYEIPADSGHNSPETRISVSSEEMFNLSEYGLKYETAEDISILDSGDILMAATEKHSQLKDTQCTDAVILDRNMKIKNIITLSDDKHSVKSIKIRNGKIYLFSCKGFNNDYDLSTEIWSLDESENFIYEGQYNKELSQIPCFSTGGKYGYYTSDGTEISAYNTDTDETEIIHVSSAATTDGLFEISDKAFTVQHGYFTSKKFCTDTAMKAVKSETENYVIQTVIQANMYQRSSDIIHNGHIYSLSETERCSYENDYECYSVTETDPETGISGQIPLSVPYGSMLKSFCVTDEYFLFASAVRNRESGLTEYPALLISDRKGNIVNTVKLKQGYYIHNIFTLSENRVIAVLKYDNIYGGISRYLAYEMTSSGEDVKQIDITGAPFVYSQYCKPGAGEYAFYYISTEGIYGVKDIENPDKYDTVLDFGKIHLKEAAGGMNINSLGDFGYDSENRTWYIENCGYPSGIIEIRMP